MKHNIQTEPAREREREDRQTDRRTGRQNPKVHYFQEFGTLARLHVPSVLA